MNLKRKSSFNPSKVGKSNSSKTHEHFPLELYYHKRITRINRIITFDNHGLEGYNVPI